MPKAIKKTEEIVEQSVQSTDAFILSKLENRVQKIEEFLGDLEEKMEKFHLSKVNEIYRSIDVWQNDISLEDDESNRISNIISEFLERETKTRAQMTRDEYIQLNQRLLVQIRAHLSQSKSVMSDAKRHSDDVKRKIMTLFEK